MARTRAHVANDADLDQPDAVLAGRAATGDREAFEALYHRHAPAARRAALAVTGNSHDAADAVSEAFAKLLKAIADGRLEPAAPFRAYLLATTRNAAIDAIRRTGRMDLTDDVGADRPSPAAGPSEHLIDGADVAFVSRAFQSLPERWRSVLWLTEVEEIPARDVAGLLGLSPNGVAQLAARARAGLRQRFLQAHLGSPVPEGCRQTVSLLGAYVGGALAPRDLAVVDQHLAACSACGHREEELRDLGSTIRRALVPVGGAGAARFAVGHLLHAGLSAIRRAASSPAAAARAIVPMGAASAGLLVAGVTGAGVVAANAAPAARPAPPAVRAAAPTDVRPAAAVAAPSAVPAASALAPAGAPSASATAAAPSAGAAAPATDRAPEPTAGRAASTAAPTPASRQAPPSAPMGEGASAAPVPVPLGGLPTDPASLPVDPTSLPVTVPIDPTAVPLPSCPALPPAPAPPTDPTGAVTTVTDGVTSATGAVTTATGAATTSTASTVAGAAPLPAASIARLDVSPLAAVVHLLQLLGVPATTAAAPAASSAPLPQLATPTASVAVSCPQTAAVAAVPPAQAFVDRAEAGRPV